MFSQDPNSASVRLYRPIPETTALLFPPMFHRATLLCERNDGVSKVELYTWTQEEKKDGFYTVSGRVLEDAEIQAESWELFFGDVFEHWSQTGELPEGDSYWRAYSDQSDVENDLES